MKNKNERPSPLCAVRNFYEKKSFKKIQAWTGFEPTTSAIPVKSSTNGAIKSTGNWSILFIDGREIYEKMYKV